MSFSFKKFVQLVDQEEVSDEQINELFGLSAQEKSDKQAELAKQKADEFKARRDKLKSKFSGNTEPDDGDEDDKDDPKKPVNKQPQPGQARRPQPAQAARPAQSIMQRDNNNQRAAIRTANSAHTSGQVDWATEAADPAKAVKRLARQHALETINNGDNRDPVRKIETKIKALPNGSAALLHVRAATRKWVNFAEADPDTGVSKEDMKKVDAIIAKAMAAVSAPLK